MNDAASATELIDELHRLLPSAMPAHEVLGMRADRAAEDGMAGADYVYVQGRGDRLHAFVALEDPHAVDATIDALEQVPANWRWLVTAGASPGVWVAARDRGIGVIALEDQALDIVAKAMPNPGIFIREYKMLRSEWRKLSSW